MVTTLRIRLLENNCLKILVTYLFIGVICFQSKRQLEYLRQDLKVHLIYPPSMCPEAEASKIHIFFLSTSFTRHECFQIKNNIIEINIAKLLILNVHLPTFKFDNILHVHLPTLSLTIFFISSIFLPFHFKS